MPEDKLCEDIVAYIGAFDSALKAFFYNLENPDEAVERVESIYRNYRKNGPAII